jgi:2-polyprenyl-3-methyl-5-hydroxy-6-metoxy-1,4-benzoquinol methylase
MQEELNASPDKLQALLDKTSRQWQHLGETEPHWSVLTHESYFQETFHLNRTAFYASGESEVKMLDATLARAGISRVNLSRCLELGCGVGRVTAALASRFEQVIGVDISTAHLQVADTYLKEKHISNVQYHHLNTIEAIKNLGHFDFLYSRIVLQHNPPPVMQRILMDLFNQLNAGGIAWIQIPTYKAGYHFSVDNYLEVDNSTNMEMHFFPQAALLDLIKQQNCKVLEIREDDAIGVSLTSISNTLLLQKNSL